MLGCVCFKTMNNHDWLETGRLSGRRGRRQSAASAPGARHRPALARELRGRLAHPCYQPPAATACSQLLRQPAGYTATRAHVAALAVAPLLGAPAAASCRHPARGPKQTDPFDRDVDPAAAPRHRPAPLDRVQDVASLVFHRGVSGHVRLRIADQGQSLHAAQAQVLAPRYPHRP